jgi:hypothetical protein
MLSSSVGFYQVLVRCAKIVLLTDDHSRVVLERSNAAETDYINANYIDVRLSCRASLNCVVLVFFHFPSCHFTVGQYLDMMYYGLLSKVSFDVSICIF